MWNGYHFVNRGYIKSVPFPSKIVYKREGKGLDIWAKPPHIKHCLVAPPGSKADSPEMGKRAILPALVKRSTLFTVSCHMVTYKEGVQSNPHYMATSVQRSLFLVDSQYVDTCLNLSTQPLSSVQGGCWGVVELYNHFSPNHVPNVNVQFQISIIMMIIMLFFNILFYH